MKWLRRLFGDDKTVKAEEPALTAEKLRHVLQWAAKKRRVGQGIDQPRFEQATGLKGYFGSNITIAYEANTKPAHVDGPYHKKGEVLFYPPHISFASSPELVSLTPVGDVIEMRHVTDGIRPYAFTPVSTDAALARRMAIIFDFWYRRIGLPGALDEPEPVRRQVDRSDKLKLIRAYLDDASAEYFHEVFAENDPMVWVDHREADDDIVSYVAEVLGIETLTAEETENSGRAGYRISYGRESVDVPYPEPHADRDTTIIALNEILQPGYEIRWCLASDGSDTLAFLPLAKRQWAALEKSHPEQIDAVFRKITPGTVMFG